MSMCEGGREGGEREREVLIICTTDLVCNSFGDIRSNNSRYSSQSISEAHEYSSVVRGNVQVVAAKARERQTMRAHGNGEEGHSCHCCGTKVATEKEKATREDESWRRNKSMVESR